MSLFVDVQFLHEISFRFEKFARKGDYLFNLRCPICGDSSRNKNKTRGYFFKGKHGLLYKCHNCGAAKTFGQMLQETDPAAFKRYKLEKFKATQPIVVSKAKEPEAPKHAMAEYEFCQPVLTLPRNHESREYLHYRQIPLRFHNLFYYVEKTRFLNALSDKYTGKFKEEAPRLVIPFLARDGHLLGVHARSFEAQPLKRYISLKIVPDTEDMVYGLERHDTTMHTYVVEGPIDSLFLTNALAIGSSSLYRAIEMGHCIANNTTLVFDNQPRNKDLCREINRAIERDYRVCLWPETIGQKDINEMVMAGTPANEIEYVIDQHSYEGLEAKMAYTRWRKC